MLKLTLDLNEHIANSKAEFETASDSTVTGCWNTTENKVETTVADLSLRYLKYTKKVYQPGRLELELELSFKSEYNYNLSQLVDIFKGVKVDYADDYSGITTSDPLPKVCSGYLIFEVYPRLKGASYNILLVAYSPDKYLTLKQYSRAYTGVKLGGNILVDGINVCKEDYPNVEFTISTNGLRHLSYNFGAKERIIPYLMQYNESFYDFIVRTANRCGEYFYYENGVLYLGLPDSEPSEFIASTTDVVTLSSVDFASANESNNYNYCKLDSVNFSKERSYNPAVTDEEYATSLIESGMASGTLGNYTATYTDFDEQFSKKDTVDVWRSLLTKPNLIEMIGDAAFNMMAKRGMASKKSRDKNDDYANKYLINGGKKTFHKGDMYDEHGGIYLFSTNEHLTNEGFYDKIIQREREAMSNAITIVMDSSSHKPFLIGSIIKYDSKSYIVTSAEGLVDYRGEDGKLKLERTYSAISCVEENIADGGVVTAQYYPPVAENSRIRFSTTQKAFVVDNGDPLRLNRVRIHFPWQKVSEIAITAHTICGQLRGYCDVILKFKNENSSSADKKYGLEEAPQNKLTALKDEVLKITVKSETQFSAITTSISSASDKCNAISNIGKGTIILTKNEINIIRDTIKTVDTKLKLLQPLYKLVIYYNSVQSVEKKIGDYNNNLVGKEVGTVSYSDSITLIKNLVEQIEQNKVIQKVEDVYGISLSPILDIETTFDTLCDESDNGDKMDQTSRDSLVSIKVSISTVLANIISSKEIVEQAVKDLQNLREKLVLFEGNYKGRLKESPSTKLDAIKKSIETLDEAKGNLNVSSGDVLKGQVEELVTSDKGSTALTNTENTKINEIIEQLNTLMEALNETVKKEKIETSSPWIRVAMPMASKDSGFHFIPEVDDEVLVDFEQGNVERPYVVGSLYNKNKHTPKDGNRGGGSRSITSLNGHRITFSDPKDGGAFFNSFFPLSKFVGDMVGLGKNDWNSRIDLSSENQRKLAGGIELTDEYGLYSIKMSSSSRSVSIDSPFGKVGINAFTGITINAPNGDIKISGKNVSIEAGNNLTIKSGTNITKGRVFSKALKDMNGESYTKEIADILTKPILKNMFIDLSLVRCALEAIIRPIGGTMLVKSNRYMLLETGKGSTTIASKVGEDGLVDKTKYGFKHFFPSLGNAWTGNELAKERTQKEKYRIMLMNLPRFLDALYAANKKHWEKMQLLCKLFDSYVGKYASVANIKKPDSINGIDIAVNENGVGFNCNGEYGSFKYFNNSGVNSSLFEQTAESVAAAVDLASALASAKSKLKTKDSYFVAAAAAAKVKSAAAAAAKATALSAAADRLNKVYVMLCVAASEGRTDHIYTSVKETFDTDTQTLLADTGDNSLGRTILSYFNDEKNRNWVNASSENRGRSIGENLSFVEKRRIILTALNKYVKSVETKKVDDISYIEQCDNFISVVNPTSDSHFTKEKFRDSIGKSAFNAAFGDLDDIVDQNVWGVADTGDLLISTQKDKTLHFSGKSVDEYVMNASYADWSMVMDILKKI